MSDADEVAIRSYRASLDGLAESAKETLGEFVRVETKGGLHEFEVWYEGLYHFIRLVGRTEEPSQRLGE
ncbi:hypothetical protein [Cohnella sp.]|uniref:hypothetical protein n=1 Tax=Cohnella sp. TaxID=1883426 RepID=UPI00356751E4